MKKLYFLSWSKYRKFKKPKILCVLEKTLVLSIISSKCKNEDEKIFRKTESTEVLKIIALLNNIEQYQKI